MTKSADTHGSAMQTMISEIASGRWFVGDEAPFVGNLTLGHPKLCIITGPNASGKSVVRKILSTRHHDAKIEYIHLSQQGRCASGIERAFIYGDSAEDSTGQSSAQTLLKAFKTGQGRTDSFSLMLDEPEIGASEELQAAIGLRVAQELDTMPHLFAMFIVTHSRHVVTPLLSFNPTHFRLSKDGLSLSEWTTRTVQPLGDIEGMIGESHKKWSQVSNLQRKS